MLFFICVLLLCFKEYYICFGECYLYIVCFCMHLLKQKTKNEVCLRTVKYTLAVSYQKRTLARKRTGINTP